MMPGMDGYAVCQAIRADAQHAMLPVVLVTALDPAQERVKGLEAGADDFLNKPVNQAELMARVRSLLRIKAYQDEIAAPEERARAVEPHAGAAGGRRREAARARGPAEAVLLAAAGRGHRRRRHRRPAEEPPTRDHRGVPRPARLHRVHRDRRSRGGDGRAARVPRGDGPADPGSTRARSSASPATASWCSSTIRCRCPTRRRAPCAWRCACRPRWRNWPTAGSAAATRCAWAWASRWALPPSARIGFEGRIDYGAIGTVTNLAARLCAEAGRRRGAGVAARRRRRLGRASRPRHAARSSSRAFSDRCRCCACKAKRRLPEHAPAARRAATPRMRHHARRGGPFTQTGRIGQHAARRVARSVVARSATRARTPRARSSSPRASRRCRCT